jgi:hypothetical protein
MEGPVFDAFRSQFAIVYGTNTSDPQAQEDLKCLALRASRWTDWADLEVPVIPDKDLSDDRIRTMNLVLFGDEITNSIIARINDQLPIRFAEEGIRAGDKIYQGDLGFVEVFPNPLNQDHYVVILGSRNTELIAKAIDVYRAMPDYAVFSADTEFSKPETYSIFGYFDGKWEL